MVLEEREQCHEQFAGECAFEGGNQKASWRVVAEAALRLLALTGDGDHWRMTPPPSLGLYRVGPKARLVPEADLGSVLAGIELGRPSCRPTRG